MGSDCFSFGLMERSGICVLMTHSCEFSEIPALYVPASTSLKARPGLALTALRSATGSRFRTAPDGDEVLPHNHAFPPCTGDLLSSLKAQSASTQPCPPCLGRHGCWG